MMPKKVPMPHCCWLQATLKPFSVIRLPRQACKVVFFLILKKENKTKGHAKWQCPKLFQIRWDVKTCTGANKKSIPFIVRFLSVHGYSKRENFTGANLQSNLNCSDPDCSSLLPD